MEMEKERAPESKLEREKEMDQEMETDRCRSTMDS